MPPRRDDQERFWEKVNKTATCWLWTAGATGSRAKNGYFWIGGRMVLAHRYAYEQARGPIPQGLELDHLCRAPLCIRPDHLEPVTHAENIRRSEGICALNARKTHCANGHEYHPGNIYRTRQGSGRACKTCHKQRQAAKKRKEVAVA